MRRSLLVLAALARSAAQRPAAALFAVLAIVALPLLFATGPSDPEARIESSPPSVSPMSAPPGTPAVGDILYATSLQWSGTPASFSYAWLQCNAIGASCTTAAGSPTNTLRYQIASGDTGFTIRVQVTANYAGHPSSSVTSAATGVVGGGGGAAPSNTAAPYFTASTVDGSDVCTAGCAIQGQQIGVTTGTWTNTPTSYSYQWRDCTTTSAQPPTTASCTNATGTGATTSTYTVGSGDVGKALSATVTAINSSGGTSTSVTGSCNQGYVTAAVAQLTGTPGCSPISAVVATSNAGQKFCTNAPVTCGLPDSSNTGVPPGTTLSTTGACAAWVSGGTVSTPGTTINGCQINDELFVTASNVTIENSDIATNNPVGGVRIGAGVTNVVLSYDTIHGTSATEAGTLVFAVFNPNYAVGSADDQNSVKMDHVYDYNGERIIHGPGTVTDSYDMISIAYTDAHYENIYAENGGSIYTHNTFLNVFGQTAAVYAQISNESEVIDPLTVTNNLISGGAYTVYGGSDNTGCCVPHGIFTGNRFSRAWWTQGGQFGTHAYMGTTYTWSGNIYDDDGAVVNP